MKISFFGHRDFFDYYHIGGFESFVRRLALNLAYAGNTVDYVFYNAEETKEIEISPHLKLKYFKKFEDSLNSLTQSYDHIIRIYLGRRERLRYLIFSRRGSYRARYHNICLYWPDSIIKRTMITIDSIFSSNKGRIICLSPRQYVAIHRWTRKATFILPPVPKEYFLTPDKKPIHEKINLTFLGMITSDKYIEDIIEIFKRLRNNRKFKCALYGMHDIKNKKSFEIHNWLKKQKEIEYTAFEKKNFHPKLEEIVRKVLRETDIFIQPFRRLVNTLDTPLLVLEAMASLCAIISTPAGSVKEIYGDSEFIVSQKNFFEEVMALLDKVTNEQILFERERIYKRNRDLNFDIDSIAKAFSLALKE